MGWVLPTLSFIGGEEDEIYPGDSVLQGQLRNSEVMSSLNFLLDN